ncbi:hypothetical protein EK21DRAFT_110960 [Setomelanomma holmii]|uniref:Uncharacterized protein n=1 Tax=Setomelanomma holmii TaxID=210430 RepID=A0A9P4HDJ0_9PLEO|nr:hypothetical protein EK21DRAFT_110960 [Setomelanomma holmii]
MPFPSIAEVLQYTSINYSHEEIDHTIQRLQEPKNTSESDIPDNERLRAFVAFTELIMRTHQSYPSITDENTKLEIKARDTFNAVKELVDVDTWNWIQEANGLREIHLHSKSGAYNLAWMIVLVHIAVWWGYSYNDLLHSVPEGTENGLEILDEAYRTLAVMKLQMDSMAVAGEI